MTQSSGSKNFSETARDVRRKPDVGSMRSWNPDCHVLEDMRFKYEIIQSWRLVARAHSRCLCYSWSFMDAASKDSTRIVTMLASDTATVQWLCGESCNKLDIVWFAVHFLALNSCWHLAGGCCRLSQLHLLWQMAPRSYSVVQDLPVTSPEELACWLWVEMMSWCGFVMTSPSFGEGFWPELVRQIQLIHHVVFDTDVLFTCACHNMPHTVFPLPILRSRRFWTKPELEVSWSMVVIVPGRWIVVDKHSPIFFIVLQYMVKSPAPKIQWQLA